MNLKTSPAGEWGLLTWTTKFTFGVFNLQISGQTKSRTLSDYVDSKGESFPQGSGLYCRWAELWFSEASVQPYRFCSAASVCYWAARSHEASSGETHILPHNSDFLGILIRSNLFCYQRKCIVDELRKHPQLDLSVLHSGFVTTLP